MKLTAGVLAGLCLFACACSPRALAVDAVLDLAGRLAVEEGVTGMIIGVEQRGLRRVRAFGHARLDPDRALEADAPFEIGSITKQLTAALVMQLVDAGTLRLDATVGELLPDAPLATRPVTIAQLLSHTGGVPDYTRQPSYEAVVSRAHAPWEVLQLVAALPLTSPPGRLWAYSNTDYLLLGEIVARVAGAPWADLVEARLTRPLGLRATRVCAPIERDARRPFAYDYDHRRVPAMLYLPAADGALCSTADDLLTWARALEGGRVVSPASYARMTTPAGTAIGGSGYGFGLAVGERESHRVVAHGGRIDGFAATLERWPDDDLTVVVLSTTAGNLGDRVAEQVGTDLVRGPSAVLAVRLAWAHRATIVVALVGLLGLGLGLGLKARARMRADRRDLLA